MDFTSKKIVYVIVIVLITGTSIFIYNRYRVAPDIEKATVSFVDNNGKEYELTSINNNYKIVVFAASWCRDCLEEMPALIQLQQQLATYNLTYIMLSDEADEKILKLQNKTNFKVFQLKKSFKEYEIHSIPTLFLLDNKGKILYAHVGNINIDFTTHFQKITEAIK